MYSVMRLWCQERWKTNCDKPEDGVRILTQNRILYTIYNCSRRCPGFLLCAKESVLPDSRNATRYRIPDLYLDYIALDGARYFYLLRTNKVSKYFDRLMFGCKRKQFLF